MHGTVVGYGHGWHLQSFDFFQQRIEPDRPIKEAVLAVEMKMDKFAVFQLTAPWAPRLFKGASSDCITPVNGMMSNGKNLAQVEAGKN